MRSSSTTFSLLVLTFLLSCQVCSALRAPADTVRLWEGYDVASGKEAVLYTFHQENPNGTAVIICPGGSYFWHDVKGEGMEVADFLLSQGFTPFVLLYRVPGFGAFFTHELAHFRGKTHPAMVSDAQRALQWVREHSGEYGIDPDRVGMMGFSAGGHLVMSAACYSSTDFLKANGIETVTDLRPSFVVPVYPVVTLYGPYAHRRSRRGLLGEYRRYSKAMRDSLSLQDHIPADCPPVFLTNCVDDPVVDYHNSVLLDSALTANGVNHVYHQYKAGKHGYGVSDIYGTPECRVWKYEFLEWIKTIFKNEEH